MENTDVGSYIKWGKKIEIGIPAIDEEHKREHEMFTKKVLETANNFDSASMVSALQFVKFLYDWILSHIAYEDQLIAHPVLEYYHERQNDPDFMNARPSPLL